jgi:hypothetical protein
MTERFGPGWGNYAIRGIVEAPLPESISLWPQTVGWWILASLLALWSIRRAWRAWQRYRRNRYRRDALAQLAVLRARYHAGDQNSLRQLAPLLRATALQADDRKAIASVRGDAWAAALQTLAPKLPLLPVAELEALAYQPLNPSGDSEIDDLFSRLQAWIEAHEYRNA